MFWNDKLPDKLSKVYENSNTVLLLFFSIQFFLQCAIIFTSTISTAVHKTIDPQFSQIWQTAKNNLI
jgi:hypothetical protein